MNKNKHTPGPWHYTNQIIFKDGICIAETFSRETGMDAVANARLIAAAPDLLKACKAITNIFACQRMPGFAKCREGNQCSICKAKTAIAQAEKKS